MRASQSRTSRLATGRPANVDDDADEDEPSRDLTTKPTAGTNAYTYPSPHSSPEELG